MEYLKFTLVYNSVDFSTFGVVQPLPLLVPEYFITPKIRPTLVSSVLNRRQFSMPSPMSSSTRVEAFNAPALYEDDFPVDYTPG